MQDYGSDQRLINCPENCYIYDPYAVVQKTVSRESRQNGPRQGAMPVTFAVLASAAQRVRSGPGDLGGPGYPLPAHPRGDLSVGLPGHGARALR
jgi:hypothetical protein